MILEELQDDLRWDRAFASSPDVLAKLAARAMAEYHAGKAQKLDISIGPSQVLKRYAKILFR